MKNLLKRYSGEQLLLLRIFKGNEVRTDVDSELDRRARAMNSWLAGMGPSRSVRRRLTRYDLGMAA